MDAIDRLAEIERTRAERIALPARHEARQIGLAIDHFLGRMPVRPFRHFADAFDPGPGEALASDADAVAHRLALAEDEIKEGVGRIDDDGSGRLGRRIGDDLPLQMGRQVLRLAFFRTVIRRQGRVGVAAWRRAARAGHARRSVRRRSAAGRPGRSIGGIRPWAGDVAGRPDRLFPTGIRAGGVRALTGRAALGRRIRI